MAIEAMKGAGMSYAGSSSASDVKAESQAKVETASNAAASDDLMKKTIQIDTKETDKNGKDGNRDDSQAQQTISGCYRRNFFSPSNDSCTDANRK